MRHVTQDDLRRLRKFIQDGFLRQEEQIQEIFDELEAIRTNYKKGPVIICSSQRHKEDVEQLTDLLFERNFLVYPPNFSRHLSKMIRKPEHLRLQSKSYENRVPALTYHHFHNLRAGSMQGGVCFVYNKDGYIGRNTLSEMSIAHDRNMPVLALMPHFDRIGRSRRVAKGEIYINRVLISHDGTFLKRPSKNGIDLEALCDWLETRVK